MKKLIILTILFIGIASYMNSHKIQKNYESYNIEHFNLEESVTLHDKTIIKFHKEGCPFCDKMDALDDQMIEKFNAKKNETFQFIKVVIKATTPHYQALKDRYGIKTFPTYAFFNKKVENNSLRSPSMSKEEYNNKIKLFLNS